MKEPGKASTLLKIDGMHCASCQRPIEKALRETPGVLDVSVNLANREVNALVRHFRLWSWLHLSLMLAALLGLTLIGRAG